MNTNQTHPVTPVALVTGGSAGLGRALIGALVATGWCVITDARDGDRLAAATATLPRVTALAGDLRDPAHRDRLTDAVWSYGRLDLLVHNASALGPMRTLAETSAEELDDVLATNLAAPIHLTRSVLAWLHRSCGRLVGISSDAAVEHYPTWGSYAASKAALDHAILTFGVETGLPAYAIDPGDLRTEMHQRAFPGEDISDRPLPESVVPRLLELLDSAPPTGRYRLADLPTPAEVR